MELLIEPGDPFVPTRPDRASKFRNGECSSHFRVKMAASFRWILQLHKDVPKAARFYSDGLDFSINVCTHRWAELQSGPLKLALMHSSSSGRIKVIGVLDNDANLTQAPLEYLILSWILVGCQTEDHILDQILKL
ncbi:uncharacterized protein LOC129892046 isoform X2 [Solanum dulcamara]|uniref:uncharacterized protein LOC129892046 isoform X2 n=1 Tax=Solanum dulcamara TaxID=45834 RepID=UPI0024859205|nr:uncharacterized protein LOC129892046 isoform X2 [Solanum dulcamara]